MKSQNSAEAAVLTLFHFTAAAAAAAMTMPSWEAINFCQSVDIAGSLCRGEERRAKFAFGSGGENYQANDLA